VLESGNGSPASLAVLYLELCSRLGLDLQPVALEGGRWEAAVARHGCRRRAAGPAACQQHCPAACPSPEACPAQLRQWGCFHQQRARVRLVPAPPPPFPCRYFVLQPADEAVGLRVAGERLVVDPYSEGMLLSEAEVRGADALPAPRRPCTDGRRAQQLAATEAPHLAAALQGQRAGHMPARRPGPGACCHAAVPGSKLHPQTALNKT
jgi:hypothetical protein